MSGYAFRKLDPDTFDDNATHSVRVLSSAQELDRRMADAAHRRWGAAVMELEDAERLLARIFSTLERCGEDMLKAGSRVEPSFDAMPLAHAAYLAWLSGRVAEAPVGPPVVG